MRLIINTQIVILSTLVFFTYLPVVAEDQPQENFGSVEERRIESSIAEEHANVRREREEMELHKKELKTLEDGVDKKLADMDRKLEELKNLQKKIDAALVAKSAEEKKRLQNLAGIYEKMTPAKAAQALAGLDDKLAADLLTIMKAKAAAKILDQIAKQKATELSTNISTIQLE